MERKATNRHVFLRMVREVISLILRSVNEIRNISSLRNHFLDLTFIPPHSLNTRSIDINGESAIAYLWLETNGCN